MGYRICYLRCDPAYEIIPHIHTKDGLITVGDELDALGKNVLILNDLPSIAHINGQIVVLLQSCGNCKLTIVGSQNFHYCPQCRSVLVHTVEDPDLPKA